ncbi:tRNA pseudouridine synthase Pus10-like [Ornithodoros turicata]|uniref:tRNA pseudouridine synthase Pus10-like n=1 Tax=Ornithodoros turicata TaxID=34597 RepID=UPI00313A353F
MNTIMNFVIRSEDQRTAVSDHLQSIGCCKFCVRRFLRSNFIGKVNELETPVEELNDSHDGLSPPPSKKGKVVHEVDGKADDESNCHEAHRGEHSKQESCVGCYNLLDYNHLNAALERIHQIVRDKDCSFSSYVLQISMPVTLDVRHHALLLHLKEMFGELYEGCSDITFTTVKEAWKYILSAEISRTYDARLDTQSTFQLFVTLPSGDAKQDCGFLLDAYPECFPNRLQRKDQMREIFTRRAVQEALQKIPDDELKSLYNCPPKPTTPLPSEASITCTYLPIYVAGRYCKYSRTLSQTPWLLKGKKIMETSVQELITDVINKRIPNSRVVFSASGREDVDVRMLGKGRPFLLEIVHPKKDKYSVQELEAFEREINESTSDIKVSDLQVVTKESTTAIKAGEKNEAKKYSALCCASRPLTSKDVAVIEEQKLVVLKQKTPIRVLHRRNLAERERAVYKMSAEILEDGTFKLEVQTQAGTYVKEFVHGDFGRTTPSLGDLIGAEVDIMELDVHEVSLNWPPPR